MRLPLSHGCNNVKFVLLDDTVSLKLYNLASHRHRKEVEGIRRVERILGSVCPRIERTNVQAGYGAMRIAIATHNGTAVHTFFELCTTSTIAPSRRNAAMCVVQQ